MNSAELTRRGFLAAPVLLAQSPNNTVRVAFIGTGNRGSYLLRHMLDVPGVQIVAICDIDPANLRKAIEQAAAKGHKPEGYAEYRRLLDRKDVDAVVIATPVDLHKEMAVAALEVGKNVYCEKPMAVTPEDCRTVMNAAAAAKGIFQLGFQLRHDPNRVAAMDYIKKGGIGRVLFLQANRHGGDLPHETSWYFDRVRSGDIIVEQACHILDLMVWAAGTHPLRAYGSGGISLYVNDPPGRTAMDHYCVIYDFPGNVQLVFTQLYFDPPGFTGIRERVFGEKAAIELSSATYIERGSKGELKLESPDAGKDSTYQSVAAFIENARGHRQPLNDAPSGRTSTLTGILGRKSIYERRVVEWSEVDI